MRNIPSPSPERLRLDCSSARSIPWAGLRCWQSVPGQKKPRAALPDPQVWQGKARRAGLGGGRRAYGFSGGPLLGLVDRHHGDAVADRIAAAAGFQAGVRGSAIRPSPNRINGKETRSLTLDAPLASCRILLATSAA